ncbi:MAG TPA: hypothetical protein VKV80_08180 [Streptosporangiaceae bacterium]|nr:hypothetical protein [Streptosporangiaceae bacterium]
MTHVRADPEERQAFRAFVRASHPDVGGDPAAFAAGLAAFGRGAAPARWPSVRCSPAGQSPAGRDPRFDAPVIFVHRPRGLAGAWVWARRRHAARHRPPRVL